MNITVRYQSRGGNTKAVAEAVAKAAAARAESIGVPINAPVDVLFIGGGIYAFNIDDSLRAYIKEIKKDEAAKVAVFTTAGFVDGTAKIIALLKENGLNVCEKTLSIKMYFRNYGRTDALGAVKLSAKNLRLIDEFVKAAIG